MEQTEKQTRLVVLRNEIANRIKRVCSNLAPEEVDELIDRMTLVRYKYDFLPNLPSIPNSDATSSTSESLELRR